jgi:hypothetical protein
MITLMQLLPSLFARESLAARETLTKAFIKYFNADGHREGSALIQTRFDHSTEYRIPLEDIARHECGGALAILTNNSPACFWILYHIYSDDAVLKECRQEIAKVLSDEPAGTGDGEKKTVRTLDMKSVIIPSPVQHTSSASFGSNVDSFDYQRFLLGTKTHSLITFKPSAAALHCALAVISLRQRY